jgi:radical SAM protein with 4Fe4S-binding SPASM domain
VISEARLISERSSGIGGSDTHHLFSLPPYGCERRLFYDKMRIEPDHPFHGNSATLRGQRLEDFVADEYARETGHKIRRTQVRRHPEHPELLVHCDRQIIGDPRGPGYLEIKVPGREAFYQLKRCGLQEAHILQMQHGLMVTGWRWGAYAVLHADTFDLIHFPVDRDEDLIASIKAKAIDAWQRIKHQEMPERLPLASRQCKQCPWRTTCQGENLKQEMKLANEFRKAVGLEINEVKDDEALVPLVQHYAETREMADQAEALLEEAKDAIKVHLGDSQAAKCSAGKVYFTVTEQERIDTAGLRKKMPEVAKEFSRKSVVRSLRVYPR